MFTWERPMWGKLIAWFRQLGVGVKFCLFMLAITAVGNLAEYGLGFRNQLPAYTPVVWAVLAWLAWIGDCRMCVNLFAWLRRLDGVIRLSLFVLAAGVVGAVLLLGWFPKWSVYLLAVLAWLGWMGSAVRNDRNGGGHG